MAGEEETQGERLVRIETKLDLFLQTTESLNNRVNRIEKWAYAVPVSILMAAGSAVGLILK